MRRGEWGGDGRGERQGQKLITFIYSALFLMMLQSASQS